LCTSTKKPLNIASKKLKPLPKTKEKGKRRRQ
jgi:hypothetical protein